MMSRWDNLVADLPREAHFALFELFDELADAMFCLKDCNGAYVAVNQAFVRRSGKRSKRDVIGRTASDLFAPVLAERYEQQDARVVQSGLPLRDELELIRRPDGSTGWYVTTKLPIRHGDEVVALVSLSRDLRIPSQDLLMAESLSRVVEEVKRRLAEPIRTAELAAVADCSSSQLDRRMRAVFGLSPSRYVLKTRVDAAADSLMAGDRSLAAIAAETGFYDQANFTRHFARITGDTPAQFRLRHRPA